VEPAGTTALGPPGPVLTLSAAPVGTHTGREFARTRATPMPSRRAPAMRGAGLAAWRRRNKGAPLRLEARKHVAVETDPPGGVPGGFGSRPGRRGYAAAMVDPQAVVTGLKGVGIGIEIVRGLVSSGAKLEAAETRLRLVDVLDQFAEAKLGLIAAKESIAERDAEIERLTLALRNKDALVKSGDAYFTRGPDGLPIGDAYCLACFELRHRPVHLVTEAKEPRLRHCPNCGENVQWSRITWPNQSG
jgi:hypothetical protein